MHNNNWFEKARSYDMPLFLEQAYQMEVNKSKKCLCPFHDDTKPTMSLKEKGGEWIFKCFSCDASGDITKFVQMKENMSPLDAVKKVLIFHGEDVEVGEKKELTPAELEEIEKRAKETAQRKAAKIADEKKLQKAARVQMTKASEHYAQNLYDAYEHGNEKIVKTIEAKFPNIYNNTEVRDLYMGWDYENDALCLINRNINGETFNIKSEKRKGFFKDWKFGATFKEYAFPGKWISWKHATAHAFGFDFMDETDNRVVICEGEKDAINLLLLGINALTLGGVTTSWEEHKHLLTGKNVFIWFDHDEAGYINAIKKYKEISDVAKSCQVIFFYKIGTFENKYDISDYITDKKMINKEQVFKSIIFSSFIPTNYVIFELEEYLDLDKESNVAKELAGLKEEEVLRDFSKCKDLISNAVKDVRGEKDEEVKLMQHLAKQLDSSRVKDDLQKLINSLFTEDSSFLGSELASLQKVIQFKKSMLTDYRQTHIYDMVKELERATQSAGFSFAKYREGLYFWTGNYFYSMKDWEIKDFIMKEYLSAAKIDFKKQTVKTRDEIILNLYGWAQSLEAWVEKEKRVINMTNGALIIRASGKFTFRNHHKKQDCAMNMLEFSYDENADAPKWKAFLNRVLPDAKDQDALMEFIGYCFLPSHMFEKFLLLYGGTGANGKSVVLEVIRDFFSKENVSSLELHRFEGHELDALKNKIINIGSEIESGGDMRKQMAALKNITATKDTLTVNPKNEKPYELYPEEKPKMAFATNKLIKSGADDGGVLRRMLLLHFNQEIKDDEKIRDLTERFRDEKSGILNMALAGLSRLIKNNGFSMSDSRAKFIDEYKSDINPVRAYMKDCLVKDEGIMIAKKFVYAHYKTWCEEKGLKEYAFRTFWSKFKEQEDFEEIRPRKYEHDLLPDRHPFIKDFRFVPNVVSEFDVGNVKLKVEENNISQTAFVAVVME